jgi:hypothetical protein
MCGKATWYKMVNAMVLKTMAHAILGTNTPPVFLYVNKEIYF